MGQVIFKLLRQNWARLARADAVCFCRPKLKFYYAVNFFDLLSKKLELMKQIHLLEIGFVIFLQGPTFSDFVDTRLLYS